MQSQVMCSWGPCLSREVGPGDLQCSLPTLTILWLCNFVIMVDTFTLRFMPSQPMRYNNLLSYSLHSWHEGSKDIPPGVSSFFSEKPWCVHKRSVFFCWSLQRLSSSAVPTMLTLEFTPFLPNCHNHSSLPCFPSLLTCFTVSVLSSLRWSLCP